MDFNHHFSKCRVFKTLYSHPLKQHVLSEVLLNNKALTSQKRLQNLAKTSPEIGTELFYAISELLLSIKIGVSRR